MNIYKRIKDSLVHEADKIRVDEVRIGLGYTAVLLEDGRAGVALTFHEGPRRGCTVFKGHYPLAGGSASELLDFLDSGDTVEAAVGLATANALSNTPKENLHEGDILEILPLRSDDQVGMVGFFAPILPKLKKRTSSIFIFEKIPEKQGDILPEQEAYRLLPRCQVALITSTTLLNHTLERLLEAASPCREVVLLGASTPLLPETFRETPVTRLSGVIVTNPGEILRIVSEGRGMRYFKGHVKKVNLDLKRQEAY
ncbi:MAG: DUF364 domain-containing protein [Deltaproteobacteria bacterium]|nr:DUF364 domain-containing protein [Deltaproteobacteria bacterium]MBW2017401.1 DUF364 domain-containing protein [Deltaproteobacteria bacterium]MBW2302962.1 DUF364 domain-containing protein [Deltaproteobacteria bacterium]